MVSRAEVILYENCHLRLYEKDNLLYWKNSGRLAGNTSPDGYVQVRINRKLYLAHRLLFLMRNGWLPEMLDHVDMDKSNNAPENLRPASRKLNTVNRDKPANNKSGVRGVCWHRACNKWSAQIKNDGVKIHLGTYVNLKDAVSARLKAEEELWHDIR